MGARHTTAQALALRCRIVLACAEGGSNIEVAERLGVHRMTVGKWRSRFVAHRLDGLHDEPRPGGPRTIGDDDVERVIVKTLEETPADATHWSTRSMAQATGMSQSAVSQDLAGVRAQAAPGRQLQAVTRTRCSSTRSATSSGLYLNPPEAAVVLCVDEKTQVQALDRTAPILPLMPGTPERRTHDYRRNGTTNLYAALDVASGNVIADHDTTAPGRGVPPVLEPDRPQRPRPTWTSTSSWTTTRPTRPRRSSAGCSATPASRCTSRRPTARWLNLVERWFAELTNQWLRRGTHRSTRELVASIRTWITNWNDDPKPFVWHKTADEILDTLASACGAGCRAPWSSSSSFPHRCT